MCVCVSVCFIWSIEDADVFAGLPPGRDGGPLSGFQRGHVASVHQSSGPLEPQSGLTRASLGAPARNTKEEKQAFWLRAALVSPASPFPDLD